MSATPTMRAAVLDEDGLSVREWPVPRPRFDEVLVRVSRAGVCGSDVHLAVERSVEVAHQPIVLGHELAGVVAELGSERRRGLEVGQRVAALPLISCGRCRRCFRGRTTLCERLQIIGIHTDGCWAEYAVVPVAQLVPVPDEVPDELAAPAVDGISTAYRALRSRGRLAPGESVAVWGVGGLGSAAVALAKALGAGRVTAVDPSEAARERAVALGADQALPPDGAARQLRSSGGVDLSLEFVGREDSVLGAATSLGPGGRAVIVGVGAGKIGVGPHMPFVNAEREIIASLGATVDDLAAVLDLLATGRLQLPGYVDGVRPMSEVVSALDELAAGGGAAARVVLDPTR